MNLQTRLREGRILSAPGVHDALSALMVERAGFEAAHLSGASIAYTRFARPDAGLLSIDEVAQVVGHIHDRVALPLIVDAHTGFGNALQVMRAVRVLERAGASAIQLEDQATPKTWVDRTDRTLISSAQMQGKIRAACDAREDAGTLVIARTDAVEVEGIEAAIERASRYAEAGADVLFVEGLYSDVDMHRARRELAHLAPMLACMVEKPSMPMRSAGELQAMGYSLAIHPCGIVRSLAHSLGGYLRNLRNEGSSAAWQDRMLDIDGLHTLIGTPVMRKLGAAYDAP